MPKVRVLVTLKPSLLDSAGRTVADALRRMDYSEVQDVRIGKVVELTLDSVDDDRVREMCDKLLANPVIENFEIQSVQ